MKTHLSIRSPHHANGFTIAELLVVIAIIGILATIAMVSYTGTLVTSKTKAAQTAAVTIQRKIEAYGSVTNAFPNASTAAAYTTALNSYGDSTLSSTGLTIGAGAGAVTSANGQNTVEVSQCSTAGSAYKIRYFDYGTGLMSTDVITGNLSGTTCSSWTILT